MGVDCTYLRPQFRGVPEIGRTNEDNEFIVTFNICDYGNMTVVESADLTFYIRVPYKNSLITLCVGSIGGEIEVSNNIGQEDACREFLDKWCARFHRTADDSVIGVYYIINELVRKGRFIEAI